MSNELFVSNNEFRTKLNKALAPDENGMVSAKHLYEMLRMDKSHFARWCNKNWVESDLLSENVDYITIRHKGETPTGGEIEVLDYRLPLRFAIKLAMKAKCNDDVKNEIVDYFLDLEDAAPKSALALQDQNKTIQLLSKRVEQLGMLFETSVNQLKEDVFSHINLLEAKGEVALSSDVEWANEMMKHVRKIVERYPRMDQKKCMDRLVERAEDYMCETYETLLADYALHHDGKKAKKILVMARDEDTRDAFERAVKDYEIDAGIYEENEGQKYLRSLSMGIEEIVPDPVEPRHEPTNDELAAMWADMDKMYGPNWEHSQNYPPEEEN